MVKLKMVNCYNADEIPDHILKEVEIVTELIGKSLTLIPECDPNILLSAMLRYFSAMVVKLTSDDPEEKKKAAFKIAKALMLNIEYMAKIKIFDKEDTGKEV